MFKEITIIIVTFNSDHNIFKLLKKLPKKIKILIVENSNRHQFKKNVEVLSKNIHCILTGSNIGYGRANNIGIRYSKTNYVLILNPDALIDEKMIYDDGPDFLDIKISQQIDKKQRTVVKINQ